MVVSPPESARDPTESRNAKGGADARIGGVLVEQSAEMSESHAAVQGEPLSGFETIFEEDRFDVSADGIALAN